MEERIGEKVYDETIQSCTFVDSKQRTDELLWIRKRRFIDLASNVVKYAVLFVPWTENRLIQHITQSHYPCGLFFFFGKKLHRSISDCFCSLRCVSHTGPSEILLITN